MNSFLKGRAMPDRRLATNFSRPTKNDVSVRLNRQTEPEPADAAQRQRAGNVRFLEKAVMDRHGVEILTKMMDFQPLRLRETRHVLGVYGHQHVRSCSTLLYFMLR